MVVTGRVVEQNATKLVRRVALSADAQVVLSTPVDEGRARSNWQVQLNAPAGGTREAYSPGKDGSTSGPNAQAAIDQVKAVIAAAKPGDEIHITNNLPYIGRLNEGWSAQAPANFVEEAVHAGVAQVQGAKVTIEGGVK
jgi:hypothetical protein